MTARAALLVTVVALLTGAAMAWLGRPSELGVETGGAPQARPTARTRPCRVLFLGNSFTQVNDLPRLVAQLTEAGTEPVHFEYEMRAPGGETLQAHARSNEVAALLHGRSWEWVVLQEQSRVPAYEGPTRTAFMYPAARQLDALARACGARTVFYETWGYKKGDPQQGPGDSFEAMQQRLVDGYATIARELSAAVAPVGPAWARAHAARPGLELWGPDGMHPAPAGSYLAACVLYTVFHGHAPVGNPFHGGLSDADARFLQQVAADTAP